MLQEACRAWIARAQEQMLSGAQAPRGFYTLRWCMQAGVN